jgi:hypothetical protein
MPTALPNNTGEDSSWETIFKWLKNRSETHTLPTRETSAEASPISAGPFWRFGGLSDVKLCGTTRLDPATKYVTISHCWGRAGEMFKTTLSSVSGLMTTIAFDSLGLMF